MLFKTTLFLKQFYEKVTQEPQMKKGYLVQNYYPENLINADKTA